MSKNFNFFVFTILFLSFFALTAQHTKPVNDSNERLEIEAKETKEAHKKIDKAEKEAKKVEKAQKKAEREIKKQEKLANTISSKKKSIKKNENKVTKLQDQMVKNKSKGKLSPADEMKMNQKTEKLIAGIAQDKEKLAKLQRKL